MKRSSPNSYLAKRKAAFLARHPRLAPKTDAALPPGPAHETDGIVLGVDDAGHPLRVGDKPRLEHAHVIGATGCGKSTLLLNCILQDIARGRGVCVLDPHGGHPDSLMNAVLAFLDDHNWFQARKVHIIAPNVPDVVVGFNPLAALPGVDHAVIAGAMIKAFERAWGDETTLEKPTTRRLLRSLFIALTERGLTLADARALLDHADAAGARQRLLQELKNEEARQDFIWIDTLARQPRSFEAFQQQVVGPLNRVAEFVACDAIRDMLGVTQGGDPAGKTIDLLSILNRGDILLADLQHGPLVDEAATDLLGKMLLRYLFLLMTHRAPFTLPENATPRFHPFFVYVDECHRFMTDDTEGLLTQARKFGIGVTLAHQYLAQLGKPGDKIYEAVRNSTELKAVFRIKSAEEAQRLAEDILPFDLERPVTASIRPVQVGFEIKSLKGSTYAVHEGAGTSEATHTSEGVSRGRTASQTWMRAIGRAFSTTRGEGSSLSSATGTAQGFNTVQSHMDSMAYTYDPASETFIGQPLPLGMNVGTADGTSRAVMATDSAQLAEAQSSFAAVTETESETEAVGGALAFSEAISSASGRSQGTSTTRGTTDGANVAEALFPVYRDFATSFHAKDNVRYQAGEVIRALPVGRAIVRFRDAVKPIAVPPPRKRDTA